MKTILSGDPTQIASLLSPEISAEKTSLQNDAKTNAMNSGRTGGQAAANVANQDKVHGDITNLIGSARGNAASGLAGTGSNLLSAGMSGTQAAFGDAKTEQAQRAAEWNDIFKSGTSLAGGIISGLPGNPGGWQDIASNAIA